MYLMCIFSTISIMQRDDGIQLVCEAICSGIFNDLGSGSNVDVCVITKVSIHDSNICFDFCTPDNFCG